MTLTLCISCISVAAPVYAESDPVLFWDEDGLLTESEGEELEAKLESISDKNELNVAIVTVPSLEGKSAMTYADDFYDTNGYGYGDTEDGILLLICQESRDWYISTAGYGITVITDAGREYLSEQFVPFLTDGEYADAFDIYADYCDLFIEQAQTGEPFDSGNLPKEPFNAGMNLLISLGIGLIVALIATGMMRGQLKTVRSKAAAGNYIKKNSMHLTNQQDFFLYSHVDRREKPKSDSSGGSSTHTSSSGTTHGGGGGKF